MSKPTTRARLAHVLTAACGIAIFFTSTPAGGLLPTAVLSGGLLALAFALHRGVRGAAPFTIGLFTATAGFNVLIAALVSTYEYDTATTATYFLAGGIQLITAGLLASRAFLRSRIGWSFIALGFATPFLIALTNATVGRLHLWPSIYFYDVALISIALAGVGAVGLARNRTWGILAIGISAVGLLGHSAFAVSMLSLEKVASSARLTTIAWTSGLSGLLVLAIFVPFAAPVFRHLFREEKASRPMPAVTGGTAAASGTSIEVEEKIAA